MGPVQQRGLYAMIPALYLKLMVSLTNVRTAYLRYKPGVF
jgi:hypothetical protein